MACLATPRLVSVISRIVQLPPPADGHEWLIMPSPDYMNGILTILRSKKCILHVE